MTLAQVKRRDGELVSFDRTRIEQAVELACDATGETDKRFIPQVTDDIIADIIRSCGEEPGTHIPSVEKIQDFVEKRLMKEGRYEVAKAYILYREKQHEKREERKEQLIEQFEKHSMKVIKSDGKKELFDVKKIQAVFERAASGYEEYCRFEDLLEAFKKNIVNEIRTADIGKLLIKTCVDLVTVENIFWQNVAARILLGDLYKQAIKNRGLAQKDIYSPEAYKALFDDYIARGLYYKDFYKHYTAEDILEAGKRLSRETDQGYEYTTVVSFAKRYLLNPNKVIKELPQEMYMSLALFLAIPEKPENRLAFAFKIYEHCSKQRISLPTPTLLNARTNYHQLSSCFKINVDDDLRGIYHAVENMAQISKFGGGVGVYLGNIRARGSSIRGVQGMSGGVNPWVKVINDTAVAVNQLGSRLGAISVTLDIWHRDIYDFLDLQTETGDIRAKAFDIFPAVSVPDLFMRRLKEDADITLFDPHEVETFYGKRLQDSFNESFDEFYLVLEKDERLTMKKTVKAKEVFKKFLKSAVETGMPYVFFRDTVNRLNPNKHAGNIYSTQLCTEICQNTSATKFLEEVIEDGKIIIRYEPGDLVVCNLASINIAAVCDPEVIADVFPVVMRVLDNVVTLNYYPIQEARRTALRYRSVGLGYLGLAEYLATRKLAYDSEEARQEVDRLFERYTFHTYRASIDIAQGTRNIRTVSRQRVFQGNPARARRRLVSGAHAFRRGVENALRRYEEARRALRLPYRPRAEHLDSRRRRHHRGAPSHLQEVLHRDESLGADHPCRPETFQGEFLVLQGIHPYEYERCHRYDGGHLSVDRPVDIVRMDDRSGQGEPGPALQLLCEVVGTGDQDRLLRAQPVRRSEG